MAYQER